jgi:hypothetical protein
MKKKWGFKPFYGKIKKTNWKNKGFRLGHHSTLKVRKDNDFEKVIKKGKLKYLLLNQVSESWTNGAGIRWNSYRTLY